MCGRRKDPKIEKQLEENRADAEAAKKVAQEDLSEAKANSLEQANEMASSEEVVTEGQLDRQAENIFDDPERKSMAALRRSKRSGGRGRRSLLTAKTGQGFYSRFGL